jgi:hypothetical protein
MLGVRSPCRAVPVPAEHSAAAEPRGRVRSTVGFRGSSRRQHPAALAVTLPRSGGSHSTRTRPHPRHRAAIIRYIVDLVFANGRRWLTSSSRPVPAWPAASRPPSSVARVLPAGAPAAGLVGVRIAGRVPGLLLAPALALAPLAVNLATFGRMYAMFLAALWAFLLACRGGGRPPTLALAEPRSAPRVRPPGRASVHRRSARGARPRRREPCGLIRRPGRPCCIAGRRPAVLPVPADAG